MRVPMIMMAMVATTLALPAAARQATDKLVEQGLNRLEDNQSSQQQVSNVFEQTQAMEKTYLEELKLLDSLNVYNTMLARQLADQDGEIAALEHSINNATLIERQIMPLLVRMVDALETFIDIDVPFLKEERSARVTALRELLSQADFTVSEKCRRVFEAYQIENEFGYTIEAYKGRVAQDNRQIAVDFLRVGRVALMYRDLAGEQFGFWNNQTRSWQALTEQQYARHITKGLKIAREEISPELFTVPLVAAVEVRQ